MSDNLVLTFIPSGRNGRGTLTARRGEEVLYVDSLNLPKGKDRADFLRKMMEKAPDVDAGEAEDQLTGLAAKAQGNGDASDKEELSIKALADLIYQDNHFAQDAGGKLFRFADGCYRRRAEEYVRGRVKALCVHGDAAWSSYKAAEVIEFIRVDAPQLRERPPLDVLNVKNGLLHAADRELLPHTSDHLSPIQLPVVFDSTATCPNIDAFVGQVFPADAHDLAWEIPAWLMLPDTSIQKAVLLTGEGANGKSTWLNLVATFLGKTNISGVSLHKLEADKFAGARLIGRLANICPDLPSEDLAGTSVFKAITGGDTLVAEYKFRDSFDFTPYARLVFSANHPPRSQDSSHAFFRRWLVVPFDRTFSGNEQIPRDILDTMLTAPTELSGLLNRALDALDRLWDRRTFSEPESVLRAWEDFHNETDPLAVWLDQATVDLPDGVVPKAVLIAEYNRHAASNGLPSIGNKRFGQAFRRLRPNVRDGQRMVGGKYLWCYAGIGLAQT
jgi:putative DNA primase/helicase